MPLLLHTPGLASRLAAPQEPVYVLYHFGVWLVLPIHHAIT